MDRQLTKGVVMQMSVVDIKKPVTSHIIKQMQIKMIFICFTKIDKDKRWTNDHSCKSAEKQEFLFFLSLFISFCLRWVFIAVHGLSPVVVCRLLTAVASLVAEHGLKRTRSSIAVAHKLSCPAAHGIFLDQESNLCPLHLQED